jgi:hypothetical protein
MHVSRKTKNHSRGSSVTPTAEIGQYRVGIAISLAALARCQSGFLSFAPDLGRPGTDLLDLMPRPGYFF